MKERLSPPLEERLTDSNWQSKRSHPAWVIMFPFGLAVVLLYFAFKGLDWASFWEVLREGHYEVLLLTLPIGSISYYLRATRWSTLLSFERKISVLSVFWANMAGYMGNLLLPARAGEFIRSAFLSRKSGTSTSYILATALAERVLDALALVLIGSIALLWQNGMPPSILSAMRMMAFVGIFGLMTLIIMPLQEERMLRLLKVLPLPDSYSQKISLQLTRFLTGMRILQNIPRLLHFLWLTGLIWLIDGIGTVIGVRIISQTLELSQALVFLSALGLSSAIPSAPGYIGVYQFVAVLVLVPFGFTKSEALAYILISQIFGYIMIVLWGLLGIWKINIPD